MQELSGLKEILESFLGESKSGISDNGQIQFNCPACSDDNGLTDGDGKYNLEINMVRGKFRCWACEHTNDMSGKLSVLIKKYAGDSLLSSYRSEIINIKKSKEYELNFNDNQLIFEEDEDLCVNLPDKTHEFKFDGNKRESYALKYLFDRGIKEKIIKKYDIRFTDGYCKNISFRNRIIITSYDKYGSLNYFTGRDYSGRASRKYYNYENSNRKEIIFNEHLINWDGDIILVEGPTDHLVVPNSIPLLGKAINRDFYLFECIMKKSSQNIYIFLDDDASLDAINICHKLSSMELCGRLKIVPTAKLLKLLIKYKGVDIKKLDPSKLFELYGHKGIAWAISNAENYDCV